MNALALVLLVTAGGVVKGGKMYIKGTDVSMTERANGSGKKTPLASGQEITWLGPSDADKSIHQIEFKGKKGFVPMANLTPNQAQQELTGNEALASSGAAVKDGEGLAPATPAGDPDALAALVYLSGSSEEARKHVAEHAKAAGLGKGK